MSKKKHSESDKRPLDERIADLEESLKKQTRLAAMAAVIAAILGSGGVAGILTITTQKPLQNAEARLKQAEASSKEFEVASAQHAKSIEGLQKIAEALKQNGDSTKAMAVQKLMLQQEADFQVFFRNMSVAMEPLWGFSREAGRNCEKVLRTAEESSRKRQETLAALLK